MQNQETITELKISPLEKLVTESGLEKTKGQILLDNFSSYFQMAAEWEAKINGLKVTDVSQKAEMKMASEARKFLKEKRIDIEKTRKSLKESALREGQTIDSIAKILTNLIEPLEEKALEIEKFAENKEKERKQALVAERTELCKPYFDSSIYPLGDMSQEAFDTLLQGQKLIYEQRIKAEQAAEAERLENIRLDKVESQRRIELAPFVQFITGSQDLRKMEENDYQNYLSLLQQAKIDYEDEQAQIKAENERMAKELEAERLRVEALEKQRNERSKLLSPYIVFIRNYNSLIDKPQPEFEKEFADIKKGAEDHWEFERKEQIRKQQEEEAKEKLRLEEKRKQDKILAKERAEREKAEAELKAKAKAEKLAKEQAEQAEKAKLKAPDKSKLLDLASQFESVQLPQLKTQEATEIINSIKILQGKLVNFIKEKAETL